MRVLPGLGQEEPKGSTPDTHPWVGRIAVFRLRDGFQVSGEILAVGDEFIDTDNGAVRKEDISYARWVGAEEASIIRSKRPLGSGPYNRRFDR